MNSQHEELYAKLAEAQRLIWEAHCALEDQLDELMKMIEAEAADGN